MNISVARTNFVLLMKALTSVVDFPCGWYCSQSKILEGPLYTVRDPGLQCVQVSEPLRVNATLDGRQAVADHNLGLIASLLMIGYLNISMANIRSWRLRNTESKNMLPFKRIVMR